MIKGIYFTLRSVYFVKRLFVFILLLFRTISSLGSKKCLVIVCLPRSEEVMKVASRAAQATSCSTCGGYLDANSVIVCFRSYVIFTQIKWYILLNAGWSKGLFLYDLRSEEACKEALTDREIAKLLTHLGHHGSSRNAM